MTRVMRSALWIVALGTILGVEPANAECSPRSEAAAIRLSLKRAMRCHYRSLRYRVRPPCVESAPPACAESLVAGAVALAYGRSRPVTHPVDVARARSQLACQRAIGTAVRRFLASKLGVTVTRQRPTNLLLDRCAVTVVRDPSGVVVPSVGPQCAAAVGSPGARVDPRKLRDCLETLLALWVDRIGQTPQPRRPNIVLLLTDDQRRDTTDATHSPSGTDVMPGLRRELGGSGVEFTNAFVTTPLCCPSRASLLTGQYAHRTGVLSNAGTHGGAAVFDDTSTIGTWLQDAGYRTGFIGKYLNGYEDLWLAGQPPYVPPGWTVWQGMSSIRFFNYKFIENGVEVQYGAHESEYLTDVLREKAKAFVTESVALGQPFFLFLGHKAPHLTAVPAPRHEGRFADLAAWRPASHNEPDVSDKPAWLVSTPPLPAEAVAVLDEVRRGQLRLLLSVDESIGGSTEFGITGIMQTLRDLGVADQTIVIYTSDNGYLWGEHRLDGKSRPFEEAIRVPLFIRYPALAPFARQETRLVLNVDLAPTLAELAGVTPPIPQDGVSLVPLLDDSAVTWRTDVMTEGFPGNREWVTIHDGRWKYTETHNRSGPLARELYDLDRDPLELQSVASDPAHAARVAAMAARIQEVRPGWPDNLTGGVEENPAE